MAILTFGEMAGMHFWRVALHHLLVADVWAHIVLGRPSLLRVLLRVGVSGWVDRLLGIIALVVELLV